MSLLHDLRCPWWGERERERFSDKNVLSFQRIDETYRDTCISRWEIFNNICVCIFLEITFFSIFFVFYFFLKTQTPEWGISWVFSAVQFVSWPWPQITSLQFNIWVILCIWWTSSTKNFIIRYEYVLSYCKDLTLLNELRDMDISYLSIRIHLCLPITASLSWPWSTMVGSFLRLFLFSVSHQRFHLVH